MSIYQPLIPTGLVQLDFDYQNIQGNFQQLDTSFGVDHTPFSGNEDIGYHTVIHQTQFSPYTAPVTPAPIGGIGQIYSNQINQVNIDQALFYESGGGKVAQLTVPITPKVDASGFGYTFMAGGLIFQWGYVKGTHGSAPANFNGGDAAHVTFATSAQNINFPNALLNVWTSTYYSTTAPSTGSGFGQAQINNDTLSKTGFDWTFITSSSQYTFFSWYAIGY